MNADDTKRRAILRLIKAAEKAYDEIALNADRDLTAEELLTCEELRKAIAYAKRGERS